MNSDSNSNTLEEEARALIAKQEEFKETEEGCPIQWMTREEFLAESPFAPFYRIMFDLLNVYKAQNDGSNGKGSST
jgi:hypothetical protein